MEATTSEVILERLNNLIEANAKEHAEISTKIEKTNGSVSSLKVWRALISGGLAVLTAIVIPMALMVFGKFLEAK